MADNPDKAAKMAEIEHHAKDADVVSLQSPGHWDAHMLLQLYKARGKKIVVDHDDYSFDLSPGNPRYADLGTKECEVLGNDGKPVFRWRDGENGFDLKANVEKYEAFCASVRDADMVTTTTPYLAQKFAALNPKVRVLANSIDLDVWRPIPRPASMAGQVRIGWFGGDSHFADMGIFRTVLPELAKRHKNVRIVVQASKIPEWVPLFNAIPPEQFEWHGWTDLRFYPLFLAARHIDIGLCPLEDSEFNRCKSDIKWQELTAVGAATVAQRMLPYSASIRHGETGLLAGSDEEWSEAIEMLVTNQEWRDELARRAMVEVRRLHNLDMNCRKWEQAYVDVVEGKV